MFTARANAVERNPAVLLDCAKWERSKTGWRYVDPAAPGGVTSITYGPRGIVVKLAGPSTFPAPGPIGYAFMWLTVGDRRYHGRFHLFRKNTADTIVSRTVPTSAAEAERRFWALLSGDAAAEADQEATLRALTKAAKRPGDARSRFLLGMLHLYRFGRLTEVITAPPPAAVDELRAALVHFDRAQPELWDRAARVGDSRVPGFTAAARYSLAVATDDDVLRQQALAEMDYAIEINTFFNVFDLMAVIQGEPASSPAFQAAFATVSSYIAAPTTLECVITQPEVCSGSGLGPGSFPGTFVLFGDVFAKAGDVAGATSWYDFADATDAGWVFEGLAAERQANLAARIAAYQDADPSNDPQIIGSGRQACASCHRRIAGG